MLKVIDAKNSNLWEREILEVEDYDFYHLYSYHSLDKTGDPKLLVYELDGKKILFPIVVRPIPNTSYFDATSVYGYSGPIVNNYGALDDEFLKGFHEKLNEFFLNYNIVSAFSRLHPLFEFQEMLLKDYGEVKTLNKTVTIDLKLSNEEQKRQYRRQYRQKINQLRAKRVVVKSTCCPDDMSAFVEIYHKSLMRVNAGGFYFFSKEYFNSFMACESFGSILLVAYYESKIIAGAIFTFSNDIIQCHLCATDSSYLYLSPMKLIIDEARLLGNYMNYRYLHLGGGVGCKKDALFQFKSGFSKIFHTYKVWCKVVNGVAYNELIRAKFGGNIPETTYFPSYRV